MYPRELYKGDYYRMVHCIEEHQRLNAEGWEDVKPAGTKYIPYSALPFGEKHPDPIPDRIPRAGDPNETLSQIKSRLMTQGVPEPDAQKQADLMISSRTEPNPAAEFPKPYINDKGVDKLVHDRIEEKKAIDDGYKLKHFPGEVKPKDAVTAGTVKQFPATYVKQGFADRIVSNDAERLKAESDGFSLKTGVASPVVTVNPVHPPTPQPAPAAPLAPPFTPPVKK